MAIMLNINEIFLSIDGEVNHCHQGAFTTFVRVSGCNLRCKYCDTERAWEMDSGRNMATEEIVEKIESLKCNKVTITGGEPLWKIGGIQDLVHKLLWAKERYNISIETNGSFPIFDHVISGQLTYVMDYKLPSSGMMDRMMDLREFAKLSYFDFIKFVIIDRRDYEIAKSIKGQIQKRGGQARFAFSPVHGIMDGRQLIEWCKEDRLLDVIINLQLHKILDLEEG
jgi:7-carboxy-7-deazaguanine synthase